MIEAIKAKDVYGKDICISIRETLRAIVCDDSDIPFRIFSKEYMQLELSFLNSAKEIMSKTDEKYMKILQDPNSKPYEYEPDK